MSHLCTRTPVPFICAGHINKPREQKAKPKQTAKPKQHQSKALSRSKERDPKVQDPWKITLRTAVKASMRTSGMCSATNTSYKCICTSSAYSIARISEWAFAVTPLYAVSTSMSLYFRTVPACLIVSLQKRVQPPGGKRMQPEKRVRSACCDHLTAFIVHLPLYSYVTSCFLTF